MPEPTPDHTRTVAATALRLVKYLERRSQSHRIKWNCRIGIASGSVVGSVAGVQKYVYDVFGEAMNLASRLQGIAKPMQIMANADMRAEFVDEFSLDEEGVQNIRGFGKMRLMQVQADERQKI